CALMVKGFAYW
nr:immunoglobulin heavy chain junction region [Mus musculus]MBK4186028.1 immunoglobulin heavy chain junction region [Mus musculus]MBK4186029.1 immunoglobulin heavy chain junction region [Mus musculus]MBK4186030.1 immunoglobulin heavy chain junction region [Mus musculus]MBK4186031.1 immunoglobulin heavy chain junction region [Mus musculus]